MQDVLLADGDSAGDLRVELGQEALLLTHLCLDGPRAGRQLRDVFHGGNVPVVIIIIIIFIIMKCT